LVHCRVGRRSSRGRRFSSSSWRNGRRSLLFCFEGVSLFHDPGNRVLWVSRSGRDHSQQVNICCVIPARCAP
jgi:hypothetical protein